LPSRSCQSEEEDGKDPREGTAGGSGQLEGGYLEGSVFLWEVGHLGLEAIGHDVLERQC
jgi:hypothetical protein